MKFRNWDYFNEKGIWKPNLKQVRLQGKEKHLKNDSVHQGAHVWPCRNGIQGATKTTLLVLVVATSGKSVNSIILLIEPSVSIPIGRSPSTIPFNLS